MPSFVVVEDQHDERVALVEAIRTRWPDASVVECKDEVEATEHFKRISRGDGPVPDLAVIDVALPWSTLSEASIDPPPGFTAKSTSKAGLRLTELLWSSTTTRKVLVVLWTQGDPADLRSQGYQIAETTILRKAWSSHNSTVDSLAATLAAAGRLEVPVPPAVLAHESERAQGLPDVIDVASGILWLIGGKPTNRVRKDDLKALSQVPVIEWHDPPADDAHRLEHLVRTEFANAIRSLRQTGHLSISEVTCSRVGNLLAPDQSYAERNARLERSTGLTRGKLRKARLDLLVAAANVLLDVQPSTSVDAAQAHPAPATQPSMERDHGDEHDAETWSDSQRWYRYAVFASLLAMAIGTLLWFLEELRLFALFVGAIGLTTFVVFVRFNPDHYWRRAIGGVTISFLAANGISVAAEATTDVAEATATSSLILEFGAGPAFNVCSVLIVGLLVAAMKVEGSRPGRTVG